MQMCKTGGELKGIHLVKDGKSCGWGFVDYWYKKQFVPDGLYTLTISKSPSVVLYNYMLVSDELTEW